jgi:hypothetical protein
MSASQSSGTSAYRQFGREPKDDGFGFHSVYSKLRAEEEEEEDSNAVKFAPLVPVMQPPYGRSSRQENEANFSNSGSVTRRSLGPDAIPQQMASDAELGLDSTREHVILAASPVSSLLFAKDKVDVLIRDTFVPKGYYATASHTTQRFHADGQETVTHTLFVCASDAFTTLRRRGAAERETHYLVTTVHVQNKDSSVAHFRVQGIDSVLCKFVVVRSQIKGKRINEPRDVAQKWFIHDFVLALDDEQRLFVCVRRDATVRALDGDRLDDIPGPFGMHTVYALSRDEHGVWNHAEPIARDWGFCDVCPLPTACCSPSGQRRLNTDFKDIDDLLQALHAQVSPSAKGTSNADVRRLYPKDATRLESVREAAVTHSHQRTSADSSSTNRVPVLDAFITNGLQFARIVRTGLERLRVEEVMHVWHTGLGRYITMHTSDLHLPIRIDTEYYAFTLLLLHL